MDALDDLDDFLSNDGGEMYGGTRIVEQKATKQPRRRAPVRESSASFSAGLVKANKMAQKSKNYTLAERKAAPLEPFSKLRILARTVQPTAFEQDVKGMKFISLRDLPSTISAKVPELEIGTSFTIPFDCFVIGAVHNPQMRNTNSSSANRYSMATLTTMMENVQLMLFGRAHEGFVDNLVGGALIAVLNPSIRVSSLGKDQRILHNSISISSSSASMVVRLGQSAGYGTCASMTQAGKTCKNIVNVVDCPFCPFHASKLASLPIKRSDISAAPGKRKTAAEPRVAPGEPGKRATFKRNILSSRYPSTAARCAPPTAVARPPSMQEAMEKCAAGGGKAAQAIMLEMANRQDIPFKEKREMLMKLKDQGLIRPSAPVGASRASALERLSSISKVQGKFAGGDEADKNDTLREKAETAMQRAVSIEALSQHTTTEAKMWKCITCNRLSVKMPQDCRTGGHNIVQVKAVKRFFRCKACSRRRAVVGRAMPVAMCACGEKQWEVDSVSGARL